ncbi:MAG: hypothetical protein H0X38_01130 [Planctomycetes bacterium]|nr:hypothetical protein [Planctomycetota bacterium]
MLSGAEAGAPILKSAEPFGLARGPFVMDGNHADWGEFHRIGDGSNAVLHFKSSSDQFWDNQIGFRAAFTSDISVFDNRGRLVAISRLAYDEKNLYCAVIVQRAPLLNNSSSPQELLYGGDAIGLCVGPSQGKGVNQRFICGMYAGKPTVVAMREQWPQAKPYTYFTEASGKVTLPFVAPLSTAQCGFAHLDRKYGLDGYFAEIAIPWSEIGYAPADGLSIPFDLQIIRANPSGNGVEDTAWWHSSGSGPLAIFDLPTFARLYPAAWGTATLTTKDPLTHTPLPEMTQGDQAIFAGPGDPITFTMPRDARASLIIRRDDGWVVRELLRARPLAKGTHTVYWDGKDRDGRLMPPGSYTARLGVFDGIHSVMAGSAGSSATPPFVTENGLGAIGGMHNGPWAVGSDAGGIYLLNSGEESYPCIAKIDVQGKSLWKINAGVFAGGRAVASDGKTAFIILNNGTLLSVNAATGARVDAIGKQNSLGLGAIYEEKNEKLRCLQYGEGLVLVGQTLFYTSSMNAVLGSVDLATGTNTPNAIPLAQVAWGLCVLDAKRLLTCVDGRVVEVDITTKVVKPFALPDLVHACALTRDAHGAIYVSDNGLGVDQIKKFSPDGKLIGTFGVKGGNDPTHIDVPTTQLYDPMKFSNITGLTIGPDGLLWAVSKAVSPRRFVVLTPDGKWVRDFFGPPRTPAVGFDQDDLSRIYFSVTGWDPGYIQAKLDFARYAADKTDSRNGWKIEALHLLSQNGRDLSANPDLFSNGKITSTGLNRVQVLSYKGSLPNGKGRRYLFFPGAPLCGLMTWDKAEARWKPVAAVNGRQFETGDVPSWYDRNGDGLVQPEEMVPSSMGTSWYWIDEQLTLWGRQGSMPVASIDASGVPMYDAKQFKYYIAADQQPLHFLGNSDAQNTLGNAMPGEKGAVYAYINLGPGSGETFHDHTRDNLVVRIVDGRITWVIGHHDARCRTDGSCASAFTGIAGEVDGVVLIAEWSATFEAYSSDGLTLGWVNQMSRYQDNSLCGENYAPGTFLKDPITGKRLLIATSDLDVRVLEVSGVFGNDITRIDMPVVLKGATLNAAPMKRHVEIPSSTWAYILDPAGQQRETSDFFWNRNVPEIGIPNQQVPQATVRLRRDGGQLCVFANVLDAHSFAPGTNNRTGTDGKLGGQTGIELDFGPAAPVARTVAGVGDTRFFLTVQEGPELGGGGRFRGRAWICRPAAKPLPATPFMRPLVQSPLGDAVDGPLGLFGGPAPTAALDCQTRLMSAPGSWVLVRRRPDGLGYTMQAEIPLALMPEITAMGDVSYQRMNVTTVDTRPDLVGPFRFNAALWRLDAAGVATRTAWVEDGFTGTDATRMDPFTWGSANGDIPSTPNALFISPKIDARVPVGGSITLTASGYSPDRLVSRLEFSDGATVIGQVDGRIGSIVWIPKAAGKHALTVKAMVDKQVVATASVNVSAVVAAGKPLVTTRAESNAVTLSWQPDALARNFMVIRSRYGERSDKGMIVAEGLTATTFRDGGLGNGDTFQYFVIACGELWNISDGTFGTPSDGKQEYVASWVSQQVPTTMVSGKTYPISITYRNTGTATWTAADHYALGSQSPENNQIWGVERLAPAAPVLPGQPVTFTATAKAPAPGTYAFQFRPVRDGVAWFGDYTPTVTVTVTP